MKKLCIVIFCMLLAGCVGGGAIKDPRWGRIKTPSEGSARPIGTYNAGCLAGAQALPLEGTGYQVMRASRNRYYGDRSLIHFIDRMGHFAAKEGSVLAIGDLAQPRGGPMSSGHASHQIGLDADIWFWRSAKTLSSAERDQISAPSLVRFNGTLKDWQPYHKRLLQHAAEQPEVERIFVNPAIKKKLCETAAGEPWLRKIRPWHKHDAHFHVRLRCPAGDGQCENQLALEEGDGCDNLAWWLKEKSLETVDEKPEVAPPSKPKTLPAACEALIPQEAL